MIKNRRQFLITRSQLAKMKEALKMSLEKRTTMDPRIYEAMISGLRAQIEELEQEIAEYENLRSRKTPITIGSLEEIPSALIKVRIAKGLTQSRLAKIVHLKPQQIQRYEKNDYHGVSFDRLVEIGNALGVSFEKKVKY